MTGQTYLSRRYKRRADLDREVRRYFVYTLSDERGHPVYVGRSCNVRSRIAAHASDARWRAEKQWVFDVRSLTMVGPYTWDEAVRRERDTIERLQPSGNLDLTARDRRPQTAMRSAARAER